MAIDGGMIYAERRQAQNAADTSALAAALALANGENLYAAGQNRALSNGYNNDGVTNTVEVYNPPTSGQYAGNSEYVQVFVTATVNTSLMHFFYSGTAVNTVESIARVKPGAVGPLYLGNAIVGLKPSGCDTVQFYGNVNAEIYGGGVFSNSSDSCGLRFNGSNVNTKVHDGHTFSAVAPGFTVNGSPEIVPYPPQTNVPAFPYPPPAEMLPDISCAGNAQQVGSAMTPGNWSGNFPPNGISTFQAGVYCISGDFRLNGGDNVSGSEVVFVMVSGDIHWNGNADISLSAPTSGQYKGLLIYVPMTNAAALHLNGSSDSNLTGTVLAPASHIDFNGSGDIQAAQAQFIGYTAELGGSSDSHIYYDANDNYEANLPPELELTK